MSAGILALRGDLPKDASQPVNGSLRYAQDLIDLIRRVEQRRSALLCAGKIAVGVAAYPTRHPESPSEEHDVEVLLAKQRSGADFAITQVFFHTEQYSDLLTRARRAGVTIPIIPGVMPFTSLRRRQAPGRAHRRGTRCGTDGAAGRRGYRHRAPSVGVGATVDLANAALDAGAPGIHLYTFNEHASALEVLDKLALPRPPAPAPQAASASCPAATQRSWRASPASAPQPQIHRTAPIALRSTPQRYLPCPLIPANRFKESPMTEQNTRPHSVPRRLPPRLPAYRPPPRAEEGRRSLLGRQDRRLSAGRRRQGHPAGHSQAAAGARPDRSRSRSRHVLLLRPGARRHRPPRRRPGPFRQPPQRRGAAGHRRLLRPGPRHQGHSAAGDDQVVRHQLPLPRARRSVRTPTSRLAVQPHR